MQRLGHEVWPVNTVQFSNHTGYGAWRGQVFPASLIDECVLGMDERGVLARCDGVLSGYMGSAETGEAILRAVGRVKSANPRARFCCDPVMGDAGRGIFVQPGIPEFIRSHAVPAADIITPNQFELELLSGHAAVNAADLRAALSIVHGLGPSVVLVTSLALEDTPEDAIDLAASDGTSLFRVRTPKLGISVNGAGDAIAALFFVHWSQTGSAAKALAAAASAIFGLLKRTAEAGSQEILTVAAQEEFISPSRLFTPEQL
jgi:pyridoxine kinase